MLLWRENLYLSGGHRGGKNRKRKKYPESAGHKETSKNSIQI